MELNSGTGAQPLLQPANAQKRTSPVLSKVALVALLILLSLPLIFFAVSLVTASSAEARQYTILVPIIVAIYNMPAVLVSGVAYLLGNNLAVTGIRPRFSLVLLCVSVVASIVGVIVMVVGALLND